MKTNSDIQAYIGDILLEAPEDRARAIVDSPAAKDIMQTLSAQDAYLIIREAWESDGQILLQYVPPANIPVFFDMDCWEKDTFDMDNLVEWFWTISEISLEHLAQVLEEMDLELVIMFFQKYIQVAHVSPTDENIPDLLAMGFETFDNTFFYRFNDQLQENELVRSILKSVYTEHTNLYYGVMSYTGWEFPSEMEETAYRMHSMRLMEFGFDDPADALAIYRRIDPERLIRRDLDGRKIPQLEDGDYHLPCIYRDELEKTRDRIVTAIEELGGQTEERILFEMVYLSNKIMMADYRPINDTAEIAAAVRQARTYTSLGLEFYTRHQQSDAATILQNTNAETLFSLGYNLILKQQERLKAVLRASGSDLLPAADAERLAGLLKRRPTAAYTFSDYEDLRHDVDQLEALQHIAAGLAWQDHDLRQTNILSIEGLDLENIILTALAVNMATGAAAFAPLKKTEASAFISGITTQSGDKIRPEFTTELAGLIENLGVEPATAEAVARRLSIRCESEIMGLDRQKFDPRYITCLVIEND